MKRFNWPIIGHQPIVKYLQTVIKNDTLGHAYLFYGPNGLGKSLMADYFIKSIYCQGHELPCHTCPYCKQVANQVHPDIIYLQPQEDDPPTPRLRRAVRKNITIEQIREARAKIHHASFLNSYKIILIKPAHALSLAASNALLKVLEEPTKKTIFILISPTLKNIPATILSRIQIIKFLPVPMVYLEKYLVSQKVDKPAAYQLAHLSQGYPGKIMPLVNHPKLLTEFKQTNKQLLTQIMAGLNIRFALVEKLASQTKSIQTKNELKSFLNNLNSLMRDALLIKHMCFDKIVHLELKKELADIAAKYSSKKLAALLQKIKLTSAYLDQNINPRLALENLILEF